MANFDNDNIMKIEYIKVNGQCKSEMVALFNKRNITEEEVQKVIDMDGIDTNDKVILISKAQFENVFLNKETKLKPKELKNREKEIEKLTKEYCHNCDDDIDCDFCPTRQSINELKTI